MKAQRVKAILIGIILFTVAGASHLPGQSKRAKPRLQPGPKPDLAITALYISNDCYLIIGIRNNGPGHLPDGAYVDSNPKSVALSIKFKSGLGGSSGTGLSLVVVDPGKKLIKPGGELVYKLPNMGSVRKIEVMIDPQNNLVETDENNNKMSKTLLECPRYIEKPDLEVTDIRLKRGCTIEVTIRNLGSGGVRWFNYVPPKAVRIQMMVDSKPWGSMTLKEFDPGWKLKASGGTVVSIWNPSPRVRSYQLKSGSHVIKVAVDADGILPESEKSNNRLVRQVKCGLLVTPVNRKKI